MAVITMDISVNQGSKFSKDLFFAFCGEKLDLTGYTFKSQIRKEFNTADPSLGEFNFILMNQTTDKGGVTMELPADVSSPFPMDKPATPKTFTTTRFVYDVQWVPNGGDPDEDVETVIRGVITMTPEVTK
jgi:hypothetical protein